ncbi:hypothetical protein NDU88_002928 [Pleurodeles waltl]|uniref:Uncharacterized protein n=1 Tax=Pleurodeles waltl TaxID=8319 RepID=A0AAV7UB42_PLEWA|nr:hypothetical protein NDU88_002928 [Pleurodeles waltl]
MELFPPIHRRDLGRSPRPGPGPRLSGRGGGDAGEKTGDTPTPPEELLQRVPLFSGAFAPPALSAFLRGRTRVANPQVRSGPLALAARAVLSPAACADSGPRPLRWGDGGRRRRAGERQWARGGLGPSPRVCPGGSRPRPRPPMFPAATP